MSSAALELQRRGLSDTAADEALELLNPDQRQKLALLLDETQAIFGAARLKGAALALPENDGEEAALVALVNRAYKVEKEAEALRQERVRPLNAEVKAVNELVKSAFARLLSRFGKSSEAERMLTAYRREKAARKQREQDEANRRMREAAEAQARAAISVATAATEEERQEAEEAEAAASREIVEAEVALPLPMPKGVRTEEGRATFSEVWDFEVVDESQVPRLYLTVDLQRLRAAIKSGVRDVPGVNIFQRESMRRGV